MRYKYRPGDGTAKKIQEGPLMLESEILEVFLWVSYCSCSIRNPIRVVFLGFRIVARVKEPPSSYT